jgi:hypothetical protein
MIECFIAEKGSYRRTVVVFHHDGVSVLELLRHRPLEDEGLEERGGRPQQRERRGALSCHPCSYAVLYHCDNPPRKISYYRLRPIHFGR